MLSGERDSSAPDESASRVLSKPHMFIHFSGCGGTSIRLFAKTIFGANRTQTNLGCAPYQELWSLALHEESRCSCTAVRDILLGRDDHTRGRSLRFWSTENPVLAPIDCHTYVDYWVALRQPVDRALARIHKVYSRVEGSQHLTPLYLLPSVSPEQAIVALRNTTWMAGAHEFSGTATLNDWYTRSLNGPAAYRLPLGAIGEKHLAIAQAWLFRAAVVVPTANLSMLPRLLGVPDVMMKRMVSRGHSLYGSGGVPASPKLAELKALLELRNKIDLRLYGYASQLFESRVRLAARAPAVML